MMNPADTAHFARLARRVQSETTTMMLEADCLTALGYRVDRDLWRQRDSASVVWQRMTRLLTCTDDAFAEVERQLRPLHPCLTVKTGQSFSGNDPRYSHAKAEITWPSSERSGCARSLPAAITAALLFAKAFP